MKLDHTRAFAGYQLDLFVEAFGQDLCWLAFLITGDWDLSIEAVAGVLSSEDAEHQWSADSARRLVMAAAVGVIGPDLRKSASRAAHTTGKELVLTDPLTRVLTGRELEQRLLTIDVFTRCAFLLTVLEGLSVEDAALLLYADTALVLHARNLGLVEFASANRRLFINPQN